MCAFGLSADTLRIVAGRSCERLAKRDGTWIVVRREVFHDRARSEEASSLAVTVEPRVEAQGWRISEDGPRFLWTIAFRYARLDQPDWRAALWSAMGLFLIFALRRNMLKALGVLALAGLVASQIG